MSISSHYINLRRRIRLPGWVDTESPSTMTSQILCPERQRWIPGAGCACRPVLITSGSQTKTPTSDYTFQRPCSIRKNNYYTVTFDLSVMVDDKKADLNLGFIYYQASDYHVTTSSAGCLPLGARGR